MRFDTEQLKDYGIALLRIIVGIVFVMHGAQKVFTFGIEGVTGGFTQMGIPFPALSAWLVSGVELVGGAALILGLATRFVAVPIAFSMLVAVAMVHAKNGFFLPNGYEYALTLLVANAALVLTGSGAFALDNLIARRREIAVLSFKGERQRRAA
jgi:putative oxidoreductase